MRRELIAAASVLALMTGTALAQNSMSGTAGTTTGSTTMQNRSTTAGSTATTGTQDMASAERLIGKNVYGSDNKKVGEVEDIILDSQSGQAKQLVISSGGFLGIGDKQIAVDYNNAKYNASDDRLQLSGMTQDDVKGLPEFHYTDTTTSLNRSRAKTDNNAHAPSNNATMPAGDAAKVQPKQ